MSGLLVRTFLPLGRISRPREHLWPSMISDTVYLVPARQREVLTPARFAPGAIAPALAPSGAITGMDMWYIGFCKGFPSGNSQWGNTGRQWGNPGGSGGNTAGSGRNTGGSGEQWKTGEPKLWYLGFCKGFFLINL